MPGTVLLLTFGTGIGSALFIDGQLVPNTEFGHIEIHGKDAEERASERARELHDLSWGKWAGRVDEYLGHVEGLLWPSLFIIGGGISRKADKFIPLLSNVRARIVPAVDAEQRRHRRRGHGRGRYLTGCPAARRASFTSAMRSSPKWNTLAASTASAPASTAGGKWASSPAPPLAMTGTVTAARTARISSRSNPALVPSASIELSRISPAPSPAAAGRPGDRVDAGAAPAAVGGDLEPARRRVLRPAARRASTDSTTHCEPNRCAASASSSGRAIAAVLSADLVGAGPQQPVHVVDAAHAAADGERDEHLLGGAADHVVHGLAVAADDAVMSRNISSSAPSAS